MLNSNLVPMGRIIGVFGVKGWLKIKPDTHDIDTLIKYPGLYISIKDKYVFYKLEDSFVRNDILHVKFDNISDRNTADTFKSLNVAILRDDFPEASKNEYYWVDLIGLNVENTKGENLGTVCELMETGANSVMVVKDSQGVKRLIPFIELYVPDVNLQTKKILVNWELDY
jgi:16S rRNA processing protein RimM